MLYTLNTDNFYFKNTLKKDNVCAGKAFRMPRQLRGKIRRLGRAAWAQDIFLTLSLQKHKNNASWWKKHGKSPAGEVEAGESWKIHPLWDLSGIKANSPEIEPMVTARDERVAVQNPADN